MARVRKIMLAAASLALMGQALGVPIAADDPVMRAHRALGEGRYLEALDISRAAAFLPTGERNEAAYWAWQQMHPFIGGILDSAAVDPGPPRAPLNPARVERARRAELRGAVREITARAARTRVVILNEAHHSPRDRAFALEVARALRPLGFSILSAEAFANPAISVPGEFAVEPLARDGFPRLRTGHYVQDPIFGDFVRQALALGYRPFAHEAVSARRDGTPAEQIARREQEQAENLAEILRRNPGAKILVFVGYSHATEAPIPGYGEPTEWMAARLKRMTGIDPLTIDQTSVDETRADWRAYRDLFAPRMRGRPVIPFLDGAPMVEGNYAGAVDFQIIHPPLRLLRGRPDWMRRIGRRPVEIPRHLLPARGRRLVQAFAAEEPADAIPLDQIVVEAGRPAPPLMLPRRRVRWAVQDSAAPAGA